jgi:hypothetical protein
LAITTLTSGFSASTAFGRLGVSLDVSLVPITSVVATGVVAIGIVAIGIVVIGIVVVGT